MLKHIAGTLFTKLAATIINFIVVIITTNILGAEARGEISLVIVGITITVLVNEIIGGSALIYIIPKEEPGPILILSYVWAILVCTILSFVLPAINAFPSKYAFFVFAISLLQCFNSIHLLVLLGKEKIKLYNLIYLIQFVILLLLLLFFLFIRKERTIMSFLYSMLISYTIPLILSVKASYKEISVWKSTKLKPLIRKILKNGLNAQLATLAHLLSTRLCFYFLLGSYISVFLGKAAVGICATALSVAEAALLISGSAAMVIYTRIANSQDKNYSRELTVRLSKLCLMVTFFILLLMIIMPSSFYVYVFGDDFYEMRTVIAALSIGIAALSFSTIYTHYFSGIGKYHINTIASLLQLGVTLTLGFILIPQYKLIGVGIVISLSYLSSTVFTFILFYKESRMDVKTLLPSVDDYKSLKAYIFSIIR